MKIVSIYPIQEGFYGAYIGAQYGGDNYHHVVLSHLTSLDESDFRDILVSNQIEANIVADANAFACYLLNETFGKDAVQNVITKYPKLINMEQYNVQNP